MEGGREAREGAPPSGCNGVSACSKAVAAFQPEARASADPWLLGLYVHQLTCMQLLTCS
jgi:hypothetical protein